MTFNFEQYLRQEIKECVDSNSCDHRPTYQDEIDRLKERCHREYDAGLQLQAEIGPHDLGLCKRLYEYEQSYSREYMGLGSDLISGKCCGRWVIAPRYVFKIERVRKLKEIFHNEPKS